MRVFNHLTAVAACIAMLIAVPKVTAENNMATDLKLDDARYAAARRSPDRYALLHPVRLCRTLQAHAAAQGLPPAFFVRLIWRESRFDPKAVSHAGAQGIAQFMPATARIRGLDDPFDPTQALLKSAEFLADLYRQFGNVGLAAAAYNAGPGRVNNWLKGKSSLPKETRDYVKYVTGHPAAKWKDESTVLPEHLPDDPYSVEDWCLALPADIWNKPWPRHAWSIVVASDVSQDEARRKVQQLKKAVPGSDSRTMRPLVVPLDKTERDGRPRFSVTLSARTRAAAMDACSELLGADKACRIQRG